MSTAAIEAAPCPDWCEAKHIEDHNSEGHDGPAWPCAPIDGGYTSAQVYAGVDWDGTVYVHIEAPNVRLTSTQARDVGRYLIEAAQWAEALTI